VYCKYSHKRFIYVTYFAPLTQHSSLHKKQKQMIVAYIITLCQRNCMMLNLTNVLTHKYHHALCTLCKMLTVDAGSLARTELQWRLVTYKYSYLFTYILTYLLTYSSPVWILAAPGPTAWWPHGRHVAEFVVNVRAGGNMLQLLWWHAASLTVHDPSTHHT